MNLQNPLHILVVDDDPGHLTALKTIIKSWGYTVSSTDDGTHAVESVKERPFDLILMDVRMPRMTGYEACIELKNDESTEHIPIVFLSAKGQEDEVKQGLEVGAEEYILKPFAPDQLNKHVSRVLARFGKT